MILSHVQVEGNRNILNLTCKPLAFISYKAFLKNKKRSETSLSFSCSACFLKKNISHVISGQFQCLIGHYVYCNCFFPYCDLVNFEINLAFLSNRFPTCTKKSGQKYKFRKKKDLLRLKYKFRKEKDLLRLKKCFSSFPKSFH